MAEPVATLTQEFRVGQGCRCRTLPREHPSVRRQGVEALIVASIPMNHSASPPVGCHAIGPRGLDPSPDRGGTAKMKALSEVDSLNTEKIPCLLVFDTFRNGLEIEGLGHADNGAYQVLIGFVGQ
jgi:hypothetical protein